MELQCELGAYQALLVLVTSGEVTYELALAGAVSSEDFYLDSRWNKSHGVHNRLSLQRKDGSLVLLLG